MSSRDAQRFYDLLLIGLAFLREDRPDVLERRPSSVFTTWRNTRVLTDRERRATGRNVSLISLAMPHMEYLYGWVSSRQLQTGADRSTQHLLVVVPEGEGRLSHVKLFKPQGYKVVLTDVGLQDALRTLSSYPSLDKSSFLRAWARFTQQMSTMHAHRREE